MSKPVKPTDESTDTVAQESEIVLPWVLFYEGIYNLTLKYPAVAGTTRDGHDAKHVKTKSTANGSKQKEN